TTMVACSIGGAPVPSMTRAPTNATTPGAGSCANAGAATATNTKVAIAAAHFRLTHFPLGYVTLTLSLFNFFTFPLSWLAPSWLLVGIDAERYLTHNLVRQQWIRGVELAGTRVTKQPFELALLEHAEPAGEIEGALGDA